MTKRARKQRVQKSEPIQKKSFGRFFGAFEPIFRFKKLGVISLFIYDPQFLKLKRGQNHPKNRRKILLGQVQGTRRW